MVIAEKMRLRLRTMQKADGFVEILEGLYVITKCPPMTRILVKFKNDDEIHTAFENHHPTEDARVRSNFMSSLDLGEGSSFKYEKIVS